MLSNLGPEGIGDIENIPMSRKENWLEGRSNKAMSDSCFHVDKWNTEYIFQGKLLSGDLWLGGGLLRT